MAVSIKKSPSLQLRPLEYATPSRLHVLESCFLQMAFDMDPVFCSQQFRGPKARLGAVCHEFFAAVARGRLANIPQDGWRHELEHLWNEEVVKEERVLLGSPLESHFGPARRWPGYAINKARAMRKARDLLEYRQHITQNNGRTIRSWAERPYRAYQGKLRGRADAVYVVDNQTKIQELKTGGIYDEVRNGKKILKPYYRRQLLLYAAMHYDTTGDWPVLGCVVSLAGDTSCIDIEPAEANKEVATALGLLERYNDSVAQAQAPILLATPSQEGCRWCAYKVHCEPFWTNVSLYWHWPGSVVIEGIILAIQGMIARDYTITIRASRGNIPEGIHKIQGHRQIGLQEGQEVRFTNLFHQRGDGETDLWFSDYSEFGIVDSGQIGTGRHVCR